MFCRSALVAGCVLFAGASSASADGIGVYGRFDRDLVVSAGLGGGAGIALSGEASGFGAFELRARFLHTVGLSGGYALDPVGPTHSVWGAVEMRPLFLIFVFENGFSGDALEDLTIYNIGIEAGLEYDGDKPALLVGLGTEAPLWRSRATGLFLRFGCRALFPREGWLGPDASPMVLQLLIGLQAQGQGYLGVL